MKFVGGYGVSFGNLPRKTRYRIVIRNYFANLFVVLLLAAGISAIGVLLADVVDLNNINRYLKTPWLFALNALPLGIFMLLLFHVTSRLWVSFALGGGLFLALQLINRFKIQLREEPLTLPDFMLGTEAVKAVDISALPIGRLEVACCIIWVLISAFLFVFVKSGKIHWSVKAIGVVILAFLSAFSFFSLYKDVKLYNSFKIQGSIYSRVNQFKSRGFVYSFLVRAGSYKSVKPDGYAKDEAKKILDGYSKMPTAADAVKRPHVIAVMGEAFYDIDRIKGLEFNEGFDPLANFKRITGESYAGRVVTEVYGGGTANTEFSFLTGHSLALMPDMGSPYTSYLRKDTFSLARVLEKAGYATLAFHPGDSWFYNRVNVYEFFGFDNIFFKNAMDLKKVKYTHGYISDRDTAEFVIGKLIAHMAEKPRTPLFEFVVNIDNHGPYSKDSLGHPEMLKQPAAMDPAAYNILNNYINGLSRCDQALGYLADSLDEIDEPVVLVYFADHLPYLGENYLAYKALGFNIGQTGDLEAYLNQYETPWFIWCNRAARNQSAGLGLSEKTGAVQEISINYLGVELLKYIGINGGEYFNYLSGLEKTIPVISNRFYKFNGLFTEKLPDKEKQLIVQYRKLQYYMLMEKEAVNP